jgi:hypothetical protein
MNYILKFAIKIDGLDLFYSGGGWRAGVSDATKYDSAQTAKLVADGTKRQGLVIVPVKVLQNNNDWK